MHATLPVLDDVRAAAVRPIGAPGRSFWVLAALLGAVVAVGAVAYFDQFMTGLGEAGYSDRAFWGIYEADLVSFIAVSYGGALVSAILRLTRPSGARPSRVWPKVPRCFRCLSAWGSPSFTLADPIACGA